MNSKMNEPEEKEIVKEESEYEGSPLDSIIQRVTSYIADPKMVTTETLSELKDELEDLRGYIDGEDEESEEMAEPEPENRGGERPGLTIMIGRSAKKGIKALLLMCLLSSAGTLYAAKMNPERLPHVNQHVSETVYTSTGISVYGSLVVSTYAYALHSLIVLSTGSGSAKVELFDSSVSSFAATALQLMPPLDTTVIGPMGPLNVFCSSGLVINNTGTIPARIGIVGRVK